MHTNGPWWKSFRNRGWFVHGKDGSLVAATFSGEADTRLIVAAPELLEALEALLIDALGPNPATKPQKFWTPEERQAYEAIRKAKGE